MLPYFTHLFTSEMLGVAKPDPAFFDAALRVLGNPTRESCILIGDSLTADIRGGAAAHIRTCWYNPKDKSEPLAPKPTYTVKSLDEIRAFL
jgi:FMN phosphatase YigB (HAD superfamily)